MKRYELKILNVDCANCAAKIESKISQLPEIENVQYQFMTEKLSFDCPEASKDQLIKEIEKIIHRIEPDAKIEMQKKHHHHHDEHCDCDHEHHHHHHGEHCDCDHEHHHHHHDEHCDCDHEHHHHHHDEHCDCDHEHHEIAEKPVQDLHQKYQFILEGLDCANCAAKIERHLNHQKELSDVQVQFMNLTLKLNSTLSSSDLKDFVQKKIDEVESGITVKDSKMKKDTEISKSIDKDLIYILISAVLLVLGLLSNHEALSLFYFAACYLCVGAEILLRAFRNVFKGQIFDENFLMAVATIGAVIVSEYAEACAVMLFYQIGEYFQNKAVEKSRRSISELMDIRPEEAHVEKGGKVFTVEPENVEVGDVLVVRAGEKIPLDGIVLEGKTSLDTRALTGESRTQSVEETNEVLSGSINLDGLIKVQVTKPYHDSTVARILDLVENAGSRKAPAEAFITKFARVYTPFVCLLALLIAVIPPLFIADAQWMDYLYRACTFLVISCPCALVVSVPLSYFAGIGGLSSQGILVKGSSYLDALNRVDTYVFDKTGTLTKGNFELAEIISKFPEHCLSLAAAAEKNSNHPIAQSIVCAVDGQIKEATDVHEVAGRGVECIVEGKKVLAGNDRLMEMHQIQVPHIDKIGTMIHVSEDGKYLGTLVIEDTIRSEAKQLIAELRALGKKTVLLTGDQRAIAQQVADALEVDEVHAQLLPQDKVKVVENMMKQGAIPAFTGDGINDAPVLAMSDVGFAMGGIGSDAAIEAADIIIMNDNPSSVLTALKTALKTRRIVMENIYGALFVKFVILLLGAIGKTGMWAAVFADVGVAVLAIINAIRAMKKA